MILQTWQTIKIIWKVSGICLLLFLLCITHNPEKVEKFNNFGKKFGKISENIYVLTTNIIFYGGILLCITDTLN